MKLGDLKVGEKVKIRDKGFVGLPADEEREIDLVVHEPRPWRPGKISLTPLRPIVDIVVEYGLDPALEIIDGFIQWEL